jgi:hypothetical protein
MKMGLQMGLQNCRSFCFPADVGSWWLGDVGLGRYRWGKACEYWFGVVVYPCQFDFNKRSGMSFRQRRQTIRLVNRSEGLPIEDVKWLHTQGFKGHAEVPSPATHSLDGSLAA